MSDISSVTPQEIGRRLKVARSNAEVRQEEAAEQLQLSRPSMVAIENGSRTVRIGELQKLSKLYGVSVNSILRRKAVHIDLVSQFRKSKRSNAGIEQKAYKTLNRLVCAEGEFDAVIGLKDTRNYPPERGIAGGDVELLAEQHSFELRQWLGIETGPIADIFSRIELNLGVRLYQRKLHPSISGLYAHDDQVGACILLNANDPVYRRTHSAGYMLGHFVSTRRRPEILYKTKYYNSREERYADAFAHAFLAPRQCFDAAFNQTVARSDSLTRRHVIVLAHQFHISRQACVRRLEKLSLVNRGTLEWFEASGGISDEQPKSVIGEKFVRFDQGVADADKLVSHKIALKAHVVWKKRLLTEEQIAELLDVDRIPLREMLYEIESDETESNDLLKTTRLDR